VSRACVTNLSAPSEADQQQALSACRKVTDSIYEGLDVTCETRALRNQSLGETLLLWGGDTLDALRFAIAAKEPKLDETPVISSLQPSDPDLTQIGHSNAC
jgi:hypothetical protein